MEINNFESSLKKLTETEDICDISSFDYYMESTLINTLNHQNFTPDTPLERISMYGIISRFIIHFIKGLSFGSAVFLTNKFINSK